jgi:hypothetical protein
MKIINPFNSSKTSEVSKEPDMQPGKTPIEYPILEKPSEIPIADIPQEVPVKPKPQEIPDLPDEK